MTEENLKEIGEGLGPLHLGGGSRYLGGGLRTSFLLPKDVPRHATLKDAQNSMQNCIIHGHIRLKYYLVFFHLWNSISQAVEYNRLLFDMFSDYSFVIIDAFDSMT